MDGPALSADGPGLSAGEPVGFGVIGANSFVANAAVLPAIEAAPNARLVATASRSSDVPQRWRDTDVGSYEAVLEHPDVEAVYIPLPNGMHQEWTDRAAAADKHVLVEKPLASDAATATAMARACGDAGVLLAEAWMTPFSARYRHVFDIVGRGDVGVVGSVSSKFTFTIGPGNEDNYRWDPDQGGGALLDVGIYCLGPIVELFDAVPDHIAASRRRSTTGVDSSTEATLTWNDGRTASIVCSFVDDEAQTLQVTGDNGVIGIDIEAFTGGPGDSDILLTANGGTQVVGVAANDSYESMVDAFALAVRGAAQWPRPVERSIEMLDLIERIEDAAHD